MNTIREKGRDLFCDCSFGDCFVVIICWRRQKGRNIAKNFFSYLHYVRPQGHISIMLRQSFSILINTVNFGVRDNLSRWTGVVDVRDNVLLNFELLVERGHFPE